MPWDLSTLPKGTLGPSRIHFLGHSLQVLSQVGIRWVRIHSDWSVTIGRHDGTRGRIPALVMCSRDRLGSGQYITAVCLGRPTEGIELELDQYDRELLKALKRWNTK